LGDPPFQAGREQEQDQVATFAKLRDSTLAELAGVLDRVDPDAYETFSATIARANRVVCLGKGRERVALRGFCMRLAHMGFDAHMVGDVTAMPVGPGDVVLITSGPGNLTMTRSMVELAKRAGATVVVVTAQPDAPDPTSADFALTIPAQTMATDRDSASVLAMGTAFELAMAIFFDLAVIRIQALRGETLESMRERHFNLE
jgi:6-phospho-3-hexuloisomerase